MRISRGGAGRHLDVTANLFVVVFKESTCRLEINTYGPWHNVLSERVVCINMWDFGVVKIGHFLGPFLEGKNGRLEGHKSCDCSCGFIIAYNKVNMKRVSA